ncbi:60S ribosomal protein L35a-1 [Hordeum vulgare]|nr:60S ribosomal protein L35a-1 [Hordeum vulgare]
MAEKAREKELEAIREQYLGGSKEKKPKTVAKPRDRFRFDWASTDDTSRVDAANNQPAHGALLLYGRGFLRMVSGWCMDARASTSGYTCGAPSWASRGDRPSRPPPPSLDPCCRCGVSHFVLWRRRRRSKSNQYESTSLLQVEGVSTKEDVSYYAGKRIAYVYKAKTKSSTTTFRGIWGKVTRPHGNFGVVRAQFRSNLPATSMGKKVRVFMYPSST